MTVGSVRVTNVPGAPACAGHGGGWAEVLRDDQHRETIRAAAALVKMGNPLVRMLLGSPLHRVLDDFFLVLHLTGRKTGRRYDIPVGYVDMEGKLAVVTVARWRVNLRGEPTSR